MTVNTGNIADLPHRELKSAKSGERYSLSAVLSEVLGFEKIFVHHEIIPPGRRASAPHRHSSQEEMIFVLRGTTTAHVGSRTMILKPGDFVGFPSGSEELHFVENPTTEEVEVLVIASMRDDDEIHYAKRLT